MKLYSSLTVNICVLAIPAYQVLLLNFPVITSNKISC